MKIKNDDEALKYINIIMNCDYDSQEKGDQIIYILNEYCKGISDLIFYSKEDLTPEEVLKKAKELSKPILL
jgi:hypothetical protein